MVVFVGHENIEQFGRHILDASPDHLDKIIDAINQSNFFSAELDFTGGWGKGLPVTMLEINLDDKWRQVHYPSEADIPDELVDLEMAVEEVIASKNWIRK